MRESKDGSSMKCAVFPGDNVSPGLVQEPPKETPLAFYLGNQAPVLPAVHVRRSFSSVR